MKRGKLRESFDRGDSRKIIVSLSRILDHGKTMCHRILRYVIGSRRASIQPMKKSYSPPVILYSRRDKCISDDIMISPGRRSAA